MLECLFTVYARQSALYTSTPNRQTSKYIPVEETSEHYTVYRVSHMHTSEYILLKFLPLEGCATNYVASLYVIVANGRISNKFLCLTTILGNFFN